MKLPADSKKQTIVFILLLIILFGIVLAVDLFSKKKKITTPQNINQVSITTFPTLTVKRSETYPSDNTGELLPTYSPEIGKGINLEAPQISSSINEIQKLYSYLPYIYTFKTTKNKEVSIIIPDKDSQINSWTLTINIFGLNYRSQKGNADYDLMKNSFTETVLFVKKWIEEKGVDFTKIMINWGEEEFIQNKSQEWLTL